MSDGIGRKAALVSMAVGVTAVVLVMGASPVGAQRGRGGGAARSPQQAAFVDLAGYWVSVVTEDWQYRMMAPPKGVVDGGGGRLPLNAEGIRVTNEWDPAADEASGNLCKAYGAVGIMRMPGRLHITWQDERTLKIETDAGQQVRLFHFDGQAPPAQAPEWQGYSAASWQREGPGGTLRVVTTRMRPGYWRRNGVPYSGEAVLTEYFDRYMGPNGQSWFTVTAILSDPTYLERDYITSTSFKKEPDGSKWQPTPCEPPLMPVITSRTP